MNPEMILTLTAFLCGFIACLCFICVVQVRLDDKNKAELVETKNKLRHLEILNKYGVKQ